MRVGSFSVIIIEGRERSSSGHIEMKHAQHYTLRLCNHQHLRSDAEVIVDGKSIGSFRINGNSNLTIAGPPKDGEQGRFTFYEAGSGEAQSTGEAELSKFEKGLIQVVFRPERYAAMQQTVMRSMNALPTPTTPDIMKGYEGGMACASAGPEREEKTSGRMSFGFTSAPKAGMTGLSGQHNQKWLDCPPLDYDLNRAVEISLRLVSSGSYEPRKLVSVLQANPMPAPVE